MKNRYIPAVQWMFGITKKEARAYIQTASQETLQEIHAAFTGNARKAFYND